MNIFSCAFISEVFSRSTEIFCNSILLNSLTLKHRKCDYCGKGSDFRHVSLVFYSSHPFFSLKCVSFQSILLQVLSMSSFISILLVLLKQLYTCTLAGFAHLCVARQVCVAFTSHFSRLIFVFSHSSFSFHCFYFLVPKLGKWLYFAFFASPPLRV